MTPLPDNPQPCLRWFIALLPPQAIQEQAQELIDDLSARYQTRTAKAPPHITLIPPFERPSNAMGGIRAALEEFSQEQAPLKITLEGFSAFPPRVLFIDVLRSPALLALKANLEEHLVQQCQLERDRHPQFKPHLTLAARKLNRNKFEAMWAELKEQEFSATWLSKTFTLLRYEQFHWQVEQVFTLKK